MNEDKKVIPNADDSNKKTNEESLKGLTLADLFANSKYGTYGNAKATIVVGHPIPKPGNEKTTAHEK